MIIKRQFRPQFLLLFFVHFFFFLIKISDNRIIVIKVIWMISKRYCLSCCHSNYWAHNHFKYWSKTGSKSPIYTVACASQNMADKWAVIFICRTSLFQYLNKNIKNRKIIRAILLQWGAWKDRGNILVVSTLQIPL